jgi:hypothetical protein
MAGKKKAAKTSAAKKANPKRPTAKKSAAKRPAAKRPPAKRQAAKRSAAAPNEKLRRGAPSSMVRVAEALAEHGFPTRGGPGLGFTREDDALFERGYPNRRIVTDEAIAQDVAALQAEKALDATDPYFRIRVPAAIARAFLLGYHVGPLLFVGRGAPRGNAKRREERARAMRAGRGIDAALLEETLARHAVGMGTDTYGSWRLPKVLYLYEHFIGTDAVARAATDHLLRCASDTKAWGVAGQDPTRMNAAPHSLAFALPWLLLRAPAPLARELRARLASVRAPHEVGDREPRAYFALLHALAAPGAPLHASIAHHAFALALRSGDAALVERQMDRVGHELLWNIGRVVWLAGTARLAGELDVPGHDLPRMVDQVAPLRDPGVVRLLARIATQRAGAAAAGEWLRAHASYARPILESLARLEDEKEKRAAGAALALLKSTEPISTERLDARALEAELARIFAALRAQLHATDDRDAQIAHIRDAHEAYTEARSAAGDPIPEAYFIHCFEGHDLLDWSLLAVDAITPSP